LQGTCFPYLCKGKIKAHREAGEFSGKNNVTAIRHPISRRNNYLEIRIEATNRICVNRRQAQGYERPNKTERPPRQRSHGSPRHHLEDDRKQMKGKWPTNKDGGKDSISGAARSTIREQ
jgi:hypothetical protein